jgi:hypothetical protein
MRTILPNCLALLSEAGPRRFLLALLLRSEGRPAAGSGNLRRIHGAGAVSGPPPIATYWARGNQSGREEQRANQRRFYMSSAAAAFSESSHSV